jgi:CubicO group peptidase (beta-lactamase class C family)
MRRPQNRTCSAGPVMVPAVGPVDEDGEVNAHGFADARFGALRECFAEIVAGQPGTGAAFAAWCDGRLVADLWGGHADAGRRRPWEPGSLVQPYSVSKPFVAVCALRLAESGRLELDAVSGERP